jgi:hypothetical protein
MLGGVSRTFLGHFQQIINIFLKPQLNPSRLAPLSGDFIIGRGVWVPGHRNAPK